MVLILNNTKYGLCPAYVAIAFYAIKLINKYPSSLQLSLPGNQGKLILDATCTPADISYLTDIKLLNQAREHTEQILDRLYEQVRDKLDRKPRTYRQEARKTIWQLPGSVDLVIKNVEKQYANS